MQRREFITLLGGAAATWPLAARAQKKSMPVIGLLGFGLPDRGTPNVAAFRQGLRELGYIEDRNILIEYRWAEGKPERFPVLAAELVALKVDVIVTAGGTLGLMPADEDLLASIKQGTVGVTADVRSRIGRAGGPAVLAAKRATTNLPIVFAVVGDPVVEGLVTSLARPGSNVTGLSNVATDLVGKWIELLKQVVPGVSLVALLLKPDSMPDSAKEVRLKEAAVSARALGVQLQVVEALGPADFDRAFSDMSAKNAGALVVLPTPAFELGRQRIVDLAAKNRLPTVYASRNYVDSGGLMSYGPNVADLHGRAATYVDKILKGAKPSDLPVQQPTKFELVINLKTANALGLIVPPTLLVQADEVIE